MSEPTTDSTAPDVPAVPDASPDVLWLAMPPDGPEPVPHLMLGSDLPKTRNGLPCFYYWRAAARDGNWVNVRRGFTIRVDPRKRAEWASNFERMRRDGDEVPVVEDHRVNAANTVGYVVDAKQGSDAGPGKGNGPWYWELHQYLGDDVKNMALRNFISVGVTAQYTTSKGQALRDLLTHSAITPTPVIGDQPDAILCLSLGDDADSTEMSNAASAAAESEPPMADHSFACSQADYDKLHSHVPGLAEKDAAHKMSHVAGHIEKMSHGVSGLLKKLGLGPDDKANQGVADYPQMQGLMSRAVEKVDQLLSRPEPGPAPAPLAPMTIHYVGKTLTAARQQAVDAGLTPASVDTLLARLMQHPRDLNTLTLSREVDEGDEMFVREAQNAIDVLECLAKNPPLKVATGEKSKTQLLSRDVPGDDGSAEAPQKPANPLLDTANKMAGIAAK
jgi:hypothetical protein